MGFKPTMNWEFDFDLLDHHTYDYQDIFDDLFVYDLNEISQISSYSTSSNTSKESSVKPQDNTIKLQLNSKVYSNPKEISQQILKTVDDEFNLEAKYNSVYKNSNLQLNFKKIKKRRDPLKDENIWQPESIYKAYTNKKPHYFDKSDYPDNIPNSSCFGRINMRIKGAWTRNKYANVY